MSIGRSGLFWVGLLFVAAFISVPYVRTSIAYGGFVTVPPNFVGDDQYYFSRIHEVADGNIFIGNPYYREHADDISPAFFVADWFAAVPALFGMPIAWVGFVNLVLWGVIFYFLLIKLLTELGVARNLAIIGAAVAVIVLEYYIHRPVAMQIVFPFFLIFCIALVRWMRSHDTKAALMLASAIAINFYIYTYSFQIIVVVMVCIVVILRSRREITWRDAALVALPAALLSTPAIAYLVYQMNAPHYWETMTRIGLVATRLPTGAAVIYGVPLLLAAVPLMGLWRTTEDRRHPQVALFFFVLVVALIVMSVSNIVTARELETASHVGRFSELLGAIAVIVSVSYASWRHYAGVRKYAVCAALLVSAVVYGVRLLPATRNISRAATRHNLEIQAYAAPFAWLEKNISEPTVVLANDTISELIPMTTKHYVAFYRTAALQLVSNEEHISRYLLSRPDMVQVTAATLKDDLRMYAGTGPALHQYKTANRRVKLCRALQLQRVGVRCGDYYASAAQFLGEDFFSHIMQTRDVIQKDVPNALSKYHVQFLLIDAALDPQWKIVGHFSNKLYDDGRFQIWSREGS